MNTIYKYLPLAAIMATGFLSSCDTTEEGFEPGSKDRIALSVNSTSLLFGADDGATAEIEISSTVSWTIECDDSHFSFSQKSGKGNQNVTVTSQRNSGNEVYRSTFRVVAVDAEGLDKDQTVNMEQNIVRFPSYLDVDTDVIQEEGGELTASGVLSTINWKFESTSDISGLSIDPGFSGPGRYRPFEIKFIMEPNYSLQEREVTLEFIPENEQDQLAFAGQLPAPFTLKQAAGTLPSNLSLKMGTPTYTDCSMTLQFDSNAPIDSCGIILKDATGNEIRKGAPLATPDSRQVTWTVTDLTEGAVYTVVPFVLSRVGETLGAAQNLAMDTHFKAPEITNVSYNVSTNNVSANISFNSTVVTVTNVGIEIYEDSISTNPICSYTSENFSELNGTKTITTAEFMTPNHEYGIKAYVIYIDQNNESQYLFYRREVILTKAIKPSEDDNKPIE